MNRTYAEDGTSRRKKNSKPKYFDDDGESEVKEHTL